MFWHDFVSFAFIYYRMGGWNVKWVKDQAVVAISAIFPTKMGNIWNLKSLKGTLYFLTCFQNLKDLSKGHFSCCINQSTNFLIFKNVFAALETK